MTAQVAISICIPAYKNINYLKRLLDSISTQTFNDYEVIVTDDSPDDSVKDFLACYSSINSIHHYKNIPALGTPENWNEGIRKAKGTWIKIMHDDDWFQSTDSLQEFYNATVENPKISFFFSTFQNITEPTGEKQVVKCNSFDLFFLKLSPLHLFRRVYVGNPSCTLIKRDVPLFYDNQFKYVVDFEYYIRCIQKLGAFVYIDKLLINVGFNDEQVTKYTFLNPAVQIPENYILLKKHGNKILKNLIVYDYYWRMHRNLNIRSVQEVSQFYTQPVDPLITNIIKFQSKIPFKLLKVGLFSKGLMFVSYVLSLFRNHT